MLINKYLVGWDDLEPTILGCLCQGQNILLLGKHGCGKSTLARFIAAALDDGEEDFQFVKYSMDKENLISMVGIPSPIALKEGRLDYVTHERSIFNAKAIFMDELTRASKETQNLVLEALEEKTIFGKPLKYDFVMAAANDSTYQGAFKLDAALLDRFFCVIPAPVGDDCGADEIKEEIELNLFKRDQCLEQANKDIREAVSKIRSTYKEIFADENLRSNIVEFAARFNALTLVTIRDLNKNTKGDIYMSRRQRSAQLAVLIMSIAAYYKAIRNEPDYIQRAAQDAIKFSVCSKLGIDKSKIDPHFEMLQDLLTEEGSETALLKIDLNTGPVEERLRKLQEHIEVVKSRFKFAEIVNVIGKIANETFESKSTEKIMALHDALDGTDLHEETLLQAKIVLYNEAQKVGV